MLACVECERSILTTELQPAAHYSGVVNIALNEKVIPRIRPELLVLGFHQFHPRNSFLQSALPPPRGMIYVLRRTEMCVYKVCVEKSYFTGVHTTCISLILASSNYLFRSFCFSPFLLRKVANGLIRSRDHFLVEGNIDRR